MQLTTQPNLWNTIINKSGEDDIVIHTLIISA